MKYILKKLDEEALLLKINETFKEIENKGIP
jgi:hypothetical protein